MKAQKRIRDYGIVIGKINTGKKNAITDVNGVKVGHITLDNGGIKTGVTVILPHGGNIFRDKVMAACHIINGFGKSVGLIQIDELGTIETPIVLTNTFSIGVAADALIEYMINENDDIGLTTSSVNPVVCECNDSYLNDMRGRHVKKENIFDAIKNADAEFEEGSVGAGTGMTCYQLKGGIGSASRRVAFENRSYTVGALVLTNFGVKDDLMVDGIKAGEIISNLCPVESIRRDNGSVIIVLATDIPMTERQLKRISKRAAAGICRTGSYIGNGSGEIVIAFTTAHKIKHYGKEPVVAVKMLNETLLDDVFRAVVESTEEAVLNSLICAETTKGRDGNISYSLKEYIREILK
ncbi:MAG: P1 family peptidase [Ruminiclostridium sp.]|nr:P1 family peptidase [Ruminiclostridium sp.]